MSSIGHRETELSDIAENIKQALPFTTKHDGTLQHSLIRSARQYLQVPSSILICCLAVWGLVDLSMRLSTRIAAARNWSAGWRKDGMDWINHECFCGETYQEALAAGCQFDELASIWLRPQCIDVELTKEFSRSGPGPNGKWPYYLQEDNGTALYAEDLAMLPDLFAPTWTVFEWHVQHCTFYWRKLFRQPMTKVIMEPHFDIEHHVVHCGKGFLMRNNLSSITAGVAHVRPRGMIDIRGWSAGDTYKTKYEHIPP